jgi:tRNA-modifying protein YgfZ
MSITGIDLSTGADALGVLTIRGPDAARFLQGQLSTDIEKLGDGASTLAGLHNPQGRVIALLALVRISREDIFAVLPRELVDSVATRLRKHVLRAKARVEDDTSWRVFGASIPAAARPSIDWGGRQLVLTTTPLELSNALTRAQWDRLDIEAGIPQVYAATSETFVAQMLNLDLLGAIAFDKGCYTGQEVVARAHYRGRVKRRLQRWRHDGAATLAPGDSARSANGRALAIVRVAPRDSAGQDVLAVGNFDGPDDAPESAGAESSGVVLEGPLPLPYSLPA